MRVIAGKFRGKKLNTVKENLIRPTSDRAKESLFNIIQSRLEDSRFLDLFAGSGSISIEAISRGAKSSTLVEKDRASINIIKKNIDSLSIADKSVFKIIKSDVFKFLVNISDEYDIIFVDPPYNYKNDKEILDKIYEKNILKDGGLIIFETDKDYVFEKNFFNIKKEKVYSKSKFTFFEKKEANNV